MHIEIEPESAIEAVQQSNILHYFSKEELNVIKLEIERLLIDKKFTKSLRSFQDIPRMSQSEMSIMILNFIKMLNVALNEVLQARIDAQQPS